MSIRSLLAAVALLILLSIAWGERATLRALLAPPREAPTKPIEFDNGTVRDHARPSADAASAPTAFAPGALRKCYKGQQVTYTDVSCPPGFKEKAVAGPPVNVLPSQAPAQPVTARAATSARGTLEQALDLSKDDRLRERIMERAIQGQK